MTPELAEIMARYENVDGVMVRDDRGPWIKDAYGGYVKAAPVQHFITALEQAQQHLRDFYAEIREPYESAVPEGYLERLKLIKQRLAWLEQRVERGHMKWCSYNATDTPDGDYCNCGLAQWLAAEPAQEEA